MLPQQCALQEVAQPHSVDDKDEATSCKLNCQLHQIPNNLG
jgi:hypothetical protein